MVNSIHLLTLEQLRYRRQRLSESLERLEHGRRRLVDLINRLKRQHELRQEDASAATVKFKAPPVQQERS